MQVVPAVQLLGTTGFFALDKYFPKLVRSLAGHAVRHKELCLAEAAARACPDHGVRDAMKLGPLAYLHLEKLDAGAAVTTKRRVKSMTE